jgi:hypothetical protein
MQNEYYGKATTYQINETLDDCVMDAKSGALPWLANEFPLLGCQISCHAMAAKFRIWILSTKLNIPDLF